MFKGDKSIFCVYLSRYGCLAYTQTMLKTLSDHKIVMIVSEDNAELFQKDHQVFTLKTASHKAEHLLRSLTIQKQIKEITSKLKNQFQSYEFYFPAFHPWNLNFLKIAQTDKIDTTLTIHDYKTHIGERSLLIENLQKKMIQKSNRVIFLTNYVKQQALSELGTISAYEVVSHPIIKSKATQNLTHSPTPSLLFLGRGVEYKGLPLLLSAIETLPIEKLTIAGKQTVSIPTTNGVTVIDRYLDEKEIGNLLASHHILVLPYIEASQSGVLTLGLSAGIPMIISKVGGLEEQLPSDAAIWVEPNEKSLAEGIKRLINDPKTYDDIQVALKNFKHRNTSQERN